MRRDPVETDNLFTVGQVARRFEVDPDTVRRWERDGRLKAVRVGSLRARLFKASELERFETQERERESVGS